MNKPVVVLDPGHGGKDPGASKYGIKEKDLALDIALKVGKILENSGVKVIYTRTTDIYVSLAKRADIANKANADAFISIHINSSGKIEVNGVEIYSYPNSLKGKKLSNYILNYILAANIFRANRGLKTANFAVLRRTKMPASLVELGFISNKEDVDILVNKQDELAKAVAKGILKDIGLVYKEETDDPYLSAVDTLVRYNIIGTPVAWQDASSINPASARSLVIKVADYLNQGV